MLGLDVARPGERVHLDEGEELLRRSFASVERHDFVGDLVITEVAPLEAYVHSGITRRQLPAAQRDVFVERTVAALFAGGTSARVKTHAGCLICS